MLARRDFLAATVALPLPLPKPGPLASPNPGPLALPLPPGGWVLAGVPDERVVLIERNGPTRLLLPARGCRLVASFRLGDVGCAAICFGGTTPAGEAIDLLAVAGGGRLLMLEPWAGRTTDGAHLATRLDLLADRGGILLRRDAAIPHAGRTLWERHSWIDRWAASPAGLVDQPMRPPLPDTWQAHLAARRAIVLQQLARPVQAIDAELAATAARWPWDRS